MSPELPSHPMLRFTTMELPPEQLVPLIESTREAFRLARRGASALGYQRLCVARDEVARQTSVVAPGEAELLRCWNQVLAWYVRYATPPPF